MNTKLDKTLRELLFSHNNDYGFDVPAVTSDRSRAPLPSLSVVIPYFNSNLIALVLKNLYRALLAVRGRDASWQYEVIIVDDGSKRPAHTEIDALQYPNLRIITLDKNCGRTAARNIGLRQAKEDVVLFMDADIIVSSTLIEDHLMVRAHASDSKKITVGFFATITHDDALLQGELTGETIRAKLNDFRILCVYQPSWLGCDSDAQFIGTQFEIVRETNGFKNWPRSGFFGPWALPNMVLGGFFMVDRKASLAVAGFDESFQGYGFTEVSLPTKLIALFDHCVVPVVSDGCLHIEDYSRGESRKEKDASFRLKHEYYFSHYLGLTGREAIHEP